MMQNKYKWYNIKWILLFWVRVEVLGLLEELKKPFDFEKYPPLLIAFHPTCTRGEIRVTTLFNTYLYFHPCFILLYCFYSCDTVFYFYYNMIFVIRFFCCCFALVRVIFRAAFLPNTLGDFLYNVRTNIWDRLKI